MIVWVGLYGVASHFNQSLGSVATRSKTRLRRLRNPWAVEVNGIATRSIARDRVLWAAVSAPVATSTGIIVIEAAQVETIWILNESIGKAGKVLGANHDSTATPHRRK